MSSRVVAITKRTFSALAVPNFRLFFFGQTTSLVGTWMQSVAQSWLVFTVTHSATAIGLVLALQTLPVLLLAPYGGVIADRVNKRRLLIVLQSLMGVQALVLGLLAVTHVVVFWEICVLAMILGLNNCFETPARQAFMLEMVGPEQVRNAVSLNSTMVNAARAVGPAIAGLFIATLGVGVCFLVNAASFIAVVVLTDSDGSESTEAESTGAASKGPIARGPALRRASASALGAAAHGRDCRNARVRVSGHLARRRQADVRRQRRDVWIPHRGNGFRRGIRRPHDRGARQARDQDDDDCRDGFRGCDVVCRARAVAGHRVCRHGRDGVRGHHLHGDRQLDAATRSQAIDAGTRHGTMGGGVHGIDPHRRPADRLGRRGCGRSRRQSRWAGRRASSPRASA